MEHTVLIIEDQDDIATLAALILRKEWYVPLVAGSGEEGLCMLETHPVDLLLLDIMLPGIDGWEVCRHIRADARLATLPILAFTVRTGRSDEIRPEVALINGTIAKPFHRADLVQAVQTTLAGQVV
jgi:DNA-binding response OmpR family regulator